MSATPEQPNIYISQIPYLLPDRAMNAAYDIREKFGLASIGVEIVPLRFHSEKYLLARKQETDVDVAVAGVTTATYKDFAKDLRDFRTNPRVFLEVLKIIGGIGAQSEPLWTRMFRTHLQLAVGLGASYLAMHEEPTRLLQEHGQLEQ